MRILTGVIEDSSIEEIIAALPPRIQKRAEEIKGILETNIPQTSILRIKCCLDLIRELDIQIRIIMEMVGHLVREKKRSIRILTSVPGIGYLAAVTIIAEIGDFKDFSSGHKLASWLGLVSKVNQSADYLKMGTITKRGSKVARWILEQVAHTSARSKNTRFGSFFQRKVDAIGFEETIIAIARKIVTIIWHLMVNDEEYEEREDNKKPDVRIPKSREPKYLSLDEILSLIRDVNVFLKSPDPEGEAG